MFSFFAQGSYFILLGLGLLLGSFANVVILRWPQGMSFVRPRSFCPKCKKQIAWQDNIPVISFLLLRGRARCCQAVISWRYPLVELTMALVFVLTFWSHGGIWSWTLAEHLLLVFGLVVVSFIDLDHFLLPDLFTLSGLVIGLIGGFLNPERSFWDAMMGSIMGGGFLWTMAWLYLLFKKQEGMGGGDIKLLAWIGAVLGWKAIPFVIISSSLLGSVVGLASMKKSGAGMKTVIPFGPYLALGAGLYVWGGDTIGNWYLSVFFPAFF